MRLKRAALRAEIVGGKDSAQADKLPKWIEKR